MLRIFVTLKCLNTGAGWGPARLEAAARFTGCPACTGWAVRRETTDPATKAETIDTNVYHQIIKVEIVEARAT